MTYHPDGSRTVQIGEIAPEPIDEGDNPWDEVLHGDR